MNSNTQTSRRFAANLTGLDYEIEAEKFLPQTNGIVDIHSHIHGPRSASILKGCLQQYGVRKIFSMTNWVNVQEVQDALEDSIHFIAIPPAEVELSIRYEEPFLKRIEEFRSIGSKITKFWCAPRGVDMGLEVNRPDLLRLNAPHMKRAIALTQRLGMVCMTHISDPDTWFKGRYTDVEKYGSKESQYDQLEEVLDEFSGPFIAAHMAGTPEDLSRLDRLLASYENLYIDTSATKWIVREISKHPREEVVSFFERWSHRILFGSDVVAMDAHLSTEKLKSGKETQAQSPSEAKMLYSSRYWALRTLWEGSYCGTSPIEDEDLIMLDPNHTGEVTLRSVNLPEKVLEDIYFNTAHSLRLV